MSTLSTHLQTPSFLNEARAIAFLATETQGQNTQSQSKHPFQLQPRRLENAR